MRWIDISSSSNAVYRSIGDLGSKSDTNCLASGRKIVPELIKRFPGRIRNLVVPARDPMPAVWSEWLNALQAQKRPGFSGLRLANALFRDLDTEGTDFPLLVLDVPEIKPWVSTQTGPQVLLALSSPTNLGAAIRSSLAFGINQIVILKEACSPFHPKSIRASAGSSFQAQFFKGPSIAELSLENPRLVALDGGPSAASLSQYKWPGDSQILVGEEGKGLGRQFPRTVSIPISHDIESLNATVALAIALYDYRNQRGMSSKSSI